MEGPNAHIPVYAGALRPERVYPPQTVGLYLNISVFWFALAFLWSGMLTVVIQTMVKRVAPQSHDLALGRVLAAGALISTVVVILVGALSDRTRHAVGRRRPYMAAGVVMAVPCLLWLSRAGSLTEIFLVFCALQFSVNVSTAPFQALIPDLVPRERQGTAAAYMGLAGLLGQMKGILVCTLLIYRPGGLRDIALLLGGALVAALLWTLWRVPEAPPPDDAPVPLIDILRGAFRVDPRRYPDFTRLIGSRFLVNMGFYSATTFLLYYVQETLGVPPPQDMRVMFHILIITTVAGLMGNFPAGLLSDRISKKRVVYVSAGVTALAALVFVLTDRLALAYVAAFLFGAGFGAFAAVDWALATNLLPERDEAKYMGVWHVAFTLPQVIAPVLGGVVAYAFASRAYVAGYDLGRGFGYRAVLLLVILYFLAGVWMIRPIREPASAGS